MEKVRPYLTRRWARRYMTFGACLLLIIGLLLASYPCANLTTTSTEPFICRDLGTVQTAVGVLTQLARIGIIVLVFGFGLWLYRLGGKDGLPEEQAAKTSVTLAAALEIEAQTPKKRRNKKKPGAKAKTK